MPGTGLCGARRSYIGLPGTRTGRRPAGPRVCSGCAPRAPAPAGKFGLARGAWGRPAATPGGRTGRLRGIRGETGLPGARRGCGMPGAAGTDAAGGCSGARGTPAAGAGGGRRQRRNRPEFRLLNRACRRRRNLGRRPAELRRRRNRLAGHRRKIGTLGDLGDLRNCRDLRFFHCRQFFFRRGFRRRLHFRRRHERAAGLRRRGSRRRGCRCRRFPGNGLFLLFQQRRLEAADRRAKRLRSTAANADRREGGSGKRAALRRRRSASGDRPRTFR